MTERPVVSPAELFGICPKCLVPFTSLTDEHYHPLDPEDFDFAMSYNSHRALCREHGWPDPGPDRPPEPEPPAEQVVIHRHSNLGKDEYDLLQQTALRVKHLEGQLKELKAKRKPKRYQQYKNS